MHLMGTGFFFNSLKGKKYSQHLSSAFNIVSKVPLAVEDWNVSGDNTEHVSTETLNMGTEGSRHLYTPSTSKTPYHSIFYLYIDTHFQLITHTQQKLCAAFGSFTYLF